MDFRVDTLSTLYLLLLELFLNDRRSEPSLKTNQNHRNLLTMLIITLSSQLEKSLNNKIVIMKKKDSKD